MKKKERLHSTRHVPSELIMAFHDGELESGAAALVQEHLAACATCRRELALFRGASDLVKTLPAHGATVAPDFASIRSRAERASLKEAPLRTPRTWHVRVHNAVRPLIATAATLVIVLTLFFISTPGGERADTHDKIDTCIVEQETDAIVQGYDSLPKLYQ